MGGIASLLVGVIGVGWTVFASSMGAPGFFTLFGVVFVIIAVVGAIYQFVNATGKRRFSEFDITDGQEEPDPLNERFGGQPASNPPGTGAAEAGFCPYCGEKVEAGFRFCRKCGKELPEE
jgi:hypothetical protein